jgi:hypothetical protein
LLDTQTADEEAHPAGDFLPSDVRYIKLGAGGAWERTAIEHGTLEWGSEIDPHDLAIAGDWKSLNEAYRSNGLPASTATAYTREARDFYTAAPDVLWMTFSGGYLWWAFAEPGVVDRGSGRGVAQAARYRQLPGGWRNTDLLGRELRMADLSTKLTQLSAYRQTICSVAAKEYLFRRIRGDDGPELKAAFAAKVALADALLPIIQYLHQNDFELFADLLFAAMGWRRRSVLGGSMKEIDLLLELPATSEEAVVQVKSTADQKLVDRCLTTMREGWPKARCYLIYHTGPPAAATASEDGHVVLDGPALADAAVEYGLTNWLLRKA